MNIITNCTSCNENVKLRTSAPSRPDLQMKKGDEFDVTCSNCGNILKKHVNDFRAVTNTTVIIIGILIGIIATVVLWTFYGAIGTVSFAIPLLFWQQQMKATKSFNSYTIKRK